MMRLHEILDIQSAQKQGFDFLLRYKKFKLNLKKHFDDVKVVGILHFLC